MTSDGPCPTVGANCRGKVTADVLMDLSTVEAMVDIENSGSRMSTQGLPRFGPSLLEVKTYSCLIGSISQRVTRVLDESTGDLLLARSQGGSCYDCVF